MPGRSSLTISRQRNVKLDDTMPTSRSKAQKEGVNGKTSPNGTLRHLKPGTDYPLYLPLEPSSVLPGLPWAQKHGYAHVQRVSRTDAQVILDTLKLQETMQVVSFSL